ncbi:Cupin domain-containing protein [Dyadobacter koreensis]|uniref:Cupin domain-containing protein n=1 Tax=Dyadobacter koreensis TaxID=408657 RepID=A0A1H6QPA1_9BACT|nr:cupin domain-containing protein [Dyadobacter koreensis]SEI40832.1 Cupin domain-containing protein [Dyadobacter koreensis]
MDSKKESPLIITPEQGRSISVMGGNYRILVTGKHTAGAFATIDMLIPPAGGPGPHSHPDFQETFYVVEGQVEVKSEAGTHIATKGSYVIIPKGGIVHQFKNKSDKIVHLLCTVVPSGLEEMFEEMGEPVGPGEFLPLPVMDQKMQQHMKMLAEKFGQKLFPPDYLA